MYSRRFAIASTQRYGSSIMRRLFEERGDLLSGKVVMPSRETILMTGKIFRVAIDPARCRVRFRRRIQRTQCHRHRFIFAQLFQRLFPPIVFVIQNSAHGRRSRPGSGVFRHFKLRAHRIVEIKTRRGRAES